MTNAADLQRALLKGRIPGLIVYRGPSMIDGSPVVMVATAFAGSDNGKTGHMVQTFILPDASKGLVPLSGPGRPARFTEYLKQTGGKAICGDCKHAWQPSVSGEYAKGRCYVREDKSPAAVSGAVARGSYAEIGVSSFGDGLIPLSWLADLFAGLPVRLGTYGDPAAVPAWVSRTIISKAASRTGYTHQWRAAGALGENAALLRDVCMASVDTPEEAATARAMGWRYFRVAAGQADAGLIPGEVICPASQEHEDAHGKRSSCERCGLCSGAAGKGSARAISVLIRDHGVKSAFRRAKPALVIRAVRADGTAVAVA